MAKEYFERFNEFREFDSQNNRIISIGNPDTNSFYFSISTLESDVHFDGALMHEKFAVKRTNHLTGSNDIITLSATNEFGEETQTTVNQNVPLTREVDEQEFNSVKNSVLNKLQQLNLI